MTRPDFDQLTDRETRQLRGYCVDIFREIVVRKRCKKQADIINRTEQGEKNVSISKAKSEYAL